MSRLLSVSLHLALVMQVSCVRSGFSSGLVDGAGQTADAGPADRGPLVVGPYHAVSISDDDAIVTNSASCADPFRGGYTLVWVEYPAGSPLAYYTFVRLDASGRIVSPRSRIVASDLDYSIGNLSLLATQTGYLLFRFLDRAAWVMVLDDEGRSVSDTRVGYVSGDSFQVTPAGDGIALVFYTWSSGMHRIYLQPLDLLGAAQGAAMELLPSTSSRTRPSAQWDGDRLLVAWSQSSRIYVAAVDMDGNEIVAARPFFDTGLEQSSPNIILLGSRTGVLYYKQSGQPVAMPFDDDFVPRLVQAVVLGDANRDESMTKSVAATADYSALQWESDSDFSATQIFLATMQRDETTSFTHVSDDRYGFCCPDVAGGTSDFLLTFHGQVAGAPRLFGVVMDPSSPPPTPDAGMDGGAVADAADADSGTQQVVELAAAPMMVKPAGLVYRDPDFEVFWCGLRLGARSWDLFHARVSVTGQITAPASVITTLPEAVKSVSLVPHSSGYSVWLKDDDDDIWATSFDESAALLHGPQRIFRAPAYDIDFRDGIFNVVWSDWYGNPDQVLFLRVDSDLIPLGPDVQVEPSVNYQLSPQLTWHPTRDSYIISWSEEGHVRLLEYSPTGGAIGASTAITSLGFEQSGAGMLSDSSGNLFMWVSEERQRTSFHFRTLASDIWNSPQTFFEGNRGVSVSAAASWVDGKVAFAWRTNSETALPQIAIGWIDPYLAAPEMAPPQMLTSGQDPFRSPMLAAGPNELAIGYVGLVQGNDKLYLRILPREP